MTARPRRRAATGAACLLAGAGLAASLPPWGWWILAFPAAGAFLLLLEGAPLRRRILRGWLVGLGCFVPGLWWSHAFSWPGALVLMAVESGFFAAGAATVPARGRVARAVAFPSALALAEAARDSWPFGGLPIGGVFIGQADGPLVGVARVGGPLLLTATVFAGGVACAALAEWLRSRSDYLRSVPPPDARRRALTGWSAAALVVALGVVGALAPDGGPSVRTLRVAAVQGGGVRGFSKSQVDPAVVLQAQFDATDELLDGSLPGPPPSLVLWPEDVVSLPDLLQDDPEEAQLAATASALRATLVVGVTEDVGATAFRNEAVAFGPDGALVDRYEKVHRVPFGEYVPFRSFFSKVANLSAVPRDAIPGHGPGVLATPAGRLATLISYEVFFTDRAAGAVRAGATLIIVPTNTSSYATSQVPTQEVAVARIDAVATGRDLLQAAPTGYSAVIDHRGRVLRRSVLGRRQVLVATVHERRGSTWFDAVGPGPITGALGLLLAAALVAARRWRPGTFHP